MRGTDKERKGPVRLTATGLATPGAVKRAAFLAFGVAAVAGLVLSLVVDPWLLLVGVAAIAAAWLYTGGPKPYGYLGLGEVMVLVFFGFVATVGSAYVQVEYVPGAAWWGSLVVGLLACAILVANNVRDIPTDAVTGQAHARGAGRRDGRAPPVRRVLRRLVRSPSSRSASRNRGRCSVCWRCRSRSRRCAPSSPAPIRRRWSSALVQTSKLEVVVAVLVSVGLCLS